MWIVMNYDGLTFILVAIFLFSCSGYLGVWMFYRYCFEFQFAVSSLKGFQKESSGLTGCVHCTLICFFFLTGWWMTIKYEKLVNNFLDNFFEALIDIWPNVYLCGKRIYLSMKPCFCLLYPWTLSWVLYCLCPFDQ